MPVILNSPMVDYLTVTTFSREWGLNWKMWLLADERIKLADRQDVNRMQYKGINIPCTGGSIFWGKGEQGGKVKREHYIMQISGRLADDFILGNKAHFLGEGGGVDRRINCTRIDLQITVQDPSQTGTDGQSINWFRGLFRQVQDMGKTVNWIQNNSLESGLATVGVNKRQGTVYYRFYPKPAEGGHAPRFEMEYKGIKAVGALLAIRENGTREKIGQILKYQLKKLNSPIASEMFVYELPDGMCKIPVMVRDGESDTMLWLSSTVLSSFKKQIATHEQGHHLARLYMDAIREGLVLGEIHWGDVADGEEGE